MGKKWVFHILVSWVLVYTWQTIDRLEPLITMLEGEENAAFLSPMSIWRDVSRMSVLKLLPSFSPYSLGSHCRHACIYTEHTVALSPWERSLWDPEMECAAFVALPLLSSVPVLHFSRTQTQRLQMCGSWMSLSSSPTLTSDLPSLVGQVFSTDSRPAGQLMGNSCGVCGHVVSHKQKLLYWALCLWDWYQKQCAYLVPGDSSPSQDCHILCF